MKPPLFGERSESSAVYAAEAAAAGSVPLRRFGTFVELEQYAQALAVSSWWTETFPEAPVELEIQRRSRSATWSGAATTGDEVGIVAIVDGHGWGLETVLHELAHLAAGPAAGHGRRFREVLGALWRHEAGFEAWAALQHQMAVRELTA